MGHLFDYSNEYLMEWSAAIESALRMGGNYAFELVIEGTLIE